jgi:hypothetical protein
VLDGDLGLSTLWPALQCPWREDSVMALERQGGGGGMPPNCRLNPPVGTVTAVAKRATAAPVLPAA